jgi:hypothetical protein
MHPILHWIFLVTGINIPNGQYSVYYNFWSGFGMFLERLIELTVIGAMIYYHHNCHVKNCPRWGRYEVEGTHYKVCKPHHPDMPEGDVTYEDVAEAHRKANK